MNKTTKFLSNMFAFYVLVIVLALSTIDRVKEESRGLASPNNGFKASCKTSLNNLLLKNKSWLIFSPDFSDLNREIDISLLNKYRNQYKGKKSFDVLPNKDAESLFAWLETFAMVDKKLVTDLSNYNLAELTQFTNAFLSGRYNKLDLDTFLSSFYERLMPNNKLTIEFIAGDARIRELLALKVSKDFASKGLRVFAKDYGLFSEKSRLNKIMKTGTVKNLTNFFISLPIMYGLPPLALPALKNTTIPNRYIHEMLENGLDFDLYKRTLKGMNIKDDKFFIGYKAKVRYESFRRHYNRAAGIFFAVLAVQYYFDKEKEISVESKFLKGIIDNMTTEIENANQEIEMTKEISEDLDLSTVEHCRKFKRCLDFSKDEVLNIPQKGSEPYLACKEFGDPDNKCQEL
jgi:hypothetical protein